MWHACWLGSITLPSFLPFRGAGLERSYALTILLKGYPEWLHQTQGVPSAPVFFDFAATETVNVHPGHHPLLTNRRNTKEWPLCLTIQKYSLIF